MSNPVNRVPLGLVSMLDLAGRAQAPRSLDDVLQLGIDGTQLYLQDRRQVGGNNTSAANLTGSWSANISVPSGQYWWVHRLTLRTPGAAALAAGTSYTLGITVIPPISAPFLVSPLYNFTAAQNPIAQAEGPMLLPRGYTLGVWVAAVTLGTASQFEVWADYTPLTY